MAKKKVIEEEEVSQCPSAWVMEEIAPLTQEFGNGDLNTLRDKINEIIARG